MSIRNTGYEKVVYIKDTKTPFFYIKNTVYIVIKSIQKDSVFVSACRNVAIKIQTMYSATGGYDGR